MSAIVAAPRLTAITVPRQRDWQQVGWTIARLANLVVTVALLVGLVFWPAIALHIMWNLLIPVLPASFLIAPQLWRGICPLATLNQWSGGLFARRQLSGRLLIAANVLGMVLLVLLVPARRFLFNEDGSALAITIAMVAVAALVVGALFDRRAGFCNGVCPILPVERVYGQHPLLKLDNRRCTKCTLCIPKGCLDLDPSKSLAQALGPAVSRYRWLTTPYGVFAAALPGLIVGYYTTSNTDWTAAASVYLWVVLCCAGGYLATTAVVRVLGLTRAFSLALLAALAVVLYYWWAAPLVAEALGVPVVGMLLGRGAALALVAIWLVRSWPLLQPSDRI